MRSESPRIRLACRADAAALTRIAHAAKRHWGYAESLIELWAADLTVHPDFVAAHPVYAATQGSRILGFYALSRQGAVFDLEHLFVDPPHMGIGIGAKLFDHAIATVRSMGGASLTITSDPNAEGFYLRMGARRAGTVPSRPEGRILPALVVDVGPAREPVA